MVRNWNIPPPLYEIFDTPRLSGFHNESGVAFNVNTKGLKGFSKHPEVLRFRGKEGQLVTIHNALADEMERRGWKHKSPLWCDIKPEPIEFTPEEFIRDLGVIYTRQTVTRIKREDKLYKKRKIKK